MLVHLPGTPPGKRSPLLDSIVQEVDIRTGLVVWEWHALGHIPLADSYATTATSAYYDAFHINSIQPLAGNRLLLSARDTSAVYLVDRASGRIQWTLGGKAGNFRLGPGRAVLLPARRADDPVQLRQPVRRRGRPAVPCAHLPGADPGPGSPAPHCPGRPQVPPARTAPRAKSEGSVQPLPGGNVFVGFGSTPFFSAFTPNGRAHVRRQPALR